jgi:hypothetical protein
MQIPQIYPQTMDRHLQSVWCNIRNAMLQDQDAISRSESSIETHKKNIEFMNTRLESNLNALKALEGVKENT